MIEEKLSTEGNRYRTVLSAVYAGGDYGRLMEGVFENYLDIKFKDMHLENVSGKCSSSSVSWVRGRRLRREIRCAMHDERFSKVVMIY